jgi:uncharacterized protein (DUF1778 family)
MPVPSKSVNIRSRTRKAERIETRVNRDQKRRIEYAASLKGTTVSEFMIRSADDAATRAIREHEVWTLTGAERDVFVKAILRPQRPSARMKAAVGRYEKRVATP